VFVALGIKRGKRMSYTVICGLPRSAIFSTLSHKRMIKKNLEHKMYLLIFSKTFV
jgi:hypothetical protein